MGGLEAVRPEDAQGLVQRGVGGRVLLLADQQQPIGEERLGQLQ